MQLARSRMRVLRWLASAGVHACFVMPSPCPPRLAARSPGSEVAASTHGAALHPLPASLLANARAATRPTQQAPPISASCADHLVIRYLFERVCNDAQFEY